MTALQELLIIAEYNRLSGQEQNLINLRLPIISVFVSIILAAFTAAGVLPPGRGPFALALGSFCITLLAVFIKHTEMALRLIWRHLKDIEKECDRVGHERKVREKHRWWAGWYKYAFALFFLGIEAAFTLYVGPLLGIWSLVAGILEMAATGACLI